MIRSADALAEVAPAAGARRAGGRRRTGPSWPTGSRTRVHGQAHGWDDAQSTKRLEDWGATVVRGHGSDHSGPGGRSRSTAGRIPALPGASCSTPGPSPGAPPIDGLEGTPYWTNRDVFQDRRPPQELLAVIGRRTDRQRAGAGLRTVRRPRSRCSTSPTGCSPTRSRRRASCFCAVAADDGVSVVAGVDICCTSLRRGGNLPTSKAGDRTITAEKLLVAAGRVPSDLADVGLDSVGVDGDFPAPRDRRPDAPRDAQGGKVVDGAVGGRRHRRQGRSSPTPRTTTPRIVGPRACSARRAPRPTTAQSRG